MPIASLPIPALCVAVIVPVVLSVQVALAWCGMAVVLVSVRGRMSIGSVPTGLLCVAITVAVAL